MRVDRLDLIRYGRFTDATLDFGEPPADGPDLHVVYGPNEAGKSTIHNALLDLFYGIETRSRFDFIHAYGQMRIGATLRFDGRAVRYQRIKRSSNSLLDGAGLPVGDAALQAALGGLSREACRDMFSLDDESLERGGESILASKGELGQLLFSASAGLTDLAARLDALTKELDDFDKPGGRKGGLVELKGQLDVFENQWKAADLLVSAYQKLKQEEAAAAKAFEAARAERAAATTRLSAIAAIREAAPLAAKRAAIVVDASALAAASSRGPITEAAGAERERRASMPNRDRDCEQADRDVTLLLDRLGRSDEPNPRTLLVPDTLAAELRELASRAGALEAERVAASNAAEAAARVLDQAEVVGDGDDPDPIKVEALRAALKVWREEQARGQARDIERRLEEARIRLHRIGADLRPWAGEAAELSSLAVPAEADVRAAGAAILDAEKALNEVRSQLAAATGELQRRRAELKALGDVAALRAAADHGAVRAERERLWAQHRARLTAETADAFEAALRRDDAAVEAKLSQAGAVARLAGARADEAVAAAEVERLTAAVAAAEALVGERRAALSALASAIALELAGLSAEALVAWLRRRSEALDALSEIARLDLERARSQADRAARLGSLASALREAGVAPADPDDAETVERAADRLIAEAGAMVERRLALGRRRQELADRQDALRAAEVALAKWRRRWEAALGRCWLRELDPPPAPDAVGELLPLLEKLRAALDRRAEAYDRREKMRRDAEAFAETARSFAAALGMDEPTEDALTLFDAASGRIDRALAAQAEIDRIDARLSLLLPRIDGGIEALAGVDLAALDAETAQLEADVQRLKEAELAAHHARETARRALGGSDDAEAARAAALRAAKLEEIRAASLRHLRLRLGVMATVEAMRRYRDEHRSAMLESASAAFRTITCGRYRELKAEAVDGAERLIAVAADGSSKSASDAALSKGTLFQLYLALRVAGHAEFARMRLPPPFVLDDVFETFDDFRAEEGFRLLAEMATRGQVILLTHHRHLLPIARQVCPAVNVIDLPD